MMYLTRWKDQQRKEELQKGELTAASMADENKVQTTARVKVTRVAHRDLQSYFCIHLNDHRRKPICRLRYNEKRKFVSFFDGDTEERVDIGGNNQLYDYSSRFLKAIEKYEMVVLPPTMLEQFKNV